jgi:hypothetical protein
MLTDSLGWNAEKKRDAKGWHLQGKIKLRREVAMMLIP